MIIPIELIIYILKFIEPKKCYRCNKEIFLIDNIIYFENKEFCSTYCCEYQHY